MQDPYYNINPVKRVEGAKQPTGNLTKACEQAQTVSTDQAILTLKLVKARAKAETAEYNKRLAMQRFRPCKMYPVVIYHDGMRWVCSHGVMGDAYSDYLPDNALGQSGVEAYGEHPEQAMQNFDAMWLGSLADDLAQSADEDDDE